MDSDSNRASRRLLLGIATVVILGAALYAIFGWRFGTQRLIVRNASGVAITHIRIDVVNNNSAPNRLRADPNRWGSKRLPPGEELQFSHIRADLSANLTFVMNSAQLHTVEKHIDLWTGEDCVVEIQPDGSATTGYQTAE